MVQWSSDNDTGAEFNLLRDREEMLNVLHQYEQLLIAFSLGIEQRGTEYFSDSLGNDVNDVPTWTGLITKAKHIMAFIMREDKDYSKREKVARLTMHLPMADTFVQNAISEMMKKLFKV